MEIFLWLVGLFFFFHVYLLREFWGQREKEHWVNTGSPALLLSHRRHTGSNTVWDPRWTMWESSHLLSMLSITKGRKLHWNVKRLPWFTFLERRTSGVSSRLAVTCEAWELAEISNKPRSPGCTVRFLPCCLLSFPTDLGEFTTKSTGFSQACQYLHHWSPLWGVQCSPQHTCNQSTVLSLILPFWKDTGSA